MNKTTTVDWPMVIMFVCAVMVMGLAAIHSVWLTSHDRRVQCSAVAATTGARGLVVDRKCLVFDDGDLVDLQPVTAENP